METAAAAKFLEAAALQLAVSEAAAALKAYSGTTEGATTVATAAVGSAETIQTKSERLRQKSEDTTCGGSEVQTAQTAGMAADAVEETTVDPAAAGDVVGEATEAVEATRMKRACAAHHWKSGSVFN